VTGRVKCGKRRIRIKGRRIGEGLRLAGNEEEFVEYLVKFINTEIPTLYPDLPHILPPLTLPPYIPPLTLPKCGNRPSTMSFVYILTQIIKIFI
jgi:hypothetical protein